MGWKSHLLGKVLKMRGRGQRSEIPPRRVNRGQKEADKGAQVRVRSLGGNSYLSGRSTGIHLSKNRARAQRAEV